MNHDALRREANHEIARRQRLASRANPLGVPLRLLDAVDGPWPQELGNIVALIDSLPSQFRAALKDYMDIAMIDDLRRITRAMQKLHENVKPYKEELLPLAGPKATLKPLASRFRDAAFYEPLDEETARMLEDKIATTLETAARDLDWSPLFIVRDWSEEASDAAEPEPC